MNREHGFLKGRRVWVAGRSDMVASALVRRLWREPCEILLSGPSQLDLLRQAEVEVWTREQRPDVIFLSVSGSEGAADPNAPASFLHENLMITANVLSAAHAIGVDKLISILPGLPFREDGRSGAIRGINGPARSSLALARTCTIGLTQAYARQHGRQFTALVAGNVCGQGDGSALQSAQVLPALVRRFGAAVLRGDIRVVLRVTVRSLPEFVHADDLADAAVFVAETCHGGDAVDCDPAGEIRFDHLARLVADTVGFRGEIVVEAAGQDSAPSAPSGCRPLAALGWRPKVTLRDAVRRLNRDWRDQATATGRRSGIT
jgi:GDP-L-fucose synthase